MRQPDRSGQRDLQPPGEDQDDLEPGEKLEEDAVVWTGATDGSKLECLASELD